MIRATTCAHTPHTQNKHTIKKFKNTLFVNYYGFWFPMNLDRINYQLYTDTNCGKYP